MSETQSPKFTIGQLVTKVTRVTNGGGAFEITAVQSQPWGHEYKVRREGGKGKGGLWNSEDQLAAL